MIQTGREERLETFETIPVVFFIKEFGYPIIWQTVVSPSRFTGQTFLCEAINRMELGQSMAGILLQTIKHNTISDNCHFTSLFFFLEFVDTLLNGHSIFFRERPNQSRQLFQLSFFFFREIIEGYLRLPIIKGSKDSIGFIVIEDILEITFSIPVFLFESQESFRLILLKILHSFLNLSMKPVSIYYWRLCSVRILAVVGVIDPIADPRLDKTKRIVLFVDTELKFKLAIVDAEFYQSSVCCCVIATITMKDAIVPSILTVSFFDHFKGKDGMQVAGHSYLADEIGSKSGCMGKS